MLCVECRDDRRTGVITAMPRDCLPGSAAAERLRKLCGVNVATFAPRKTEIIVGRTQTAHRVTLGFS